MFDNFIQEKLSPADAKRWLYHVVNEELARIRQDRAVIFADGGTDHVADWVTAEAWRVLASRGPNAEVEDEDRESSATAGRSEHEIFSLDMTTNMLSQEIRSEPRIRRMARSYRELTGCEGHIAPPMLPLPRRLIIEGRAAA